MDSIAADIENGKLKVCIYLDQIIFIQFNLHIMCYIWFACAMVYQKSSSDNIESLLKLRPMTFVNYAGWQRIDRLERERGLALGKAREKIVNKEELLKVGQLWLLIKQT